VVRTRAHLAGWEGSNWQFVPDSDRDDAQPADMWVYESSKVLLQQGLVAAAYPNDQRDGSPVTYEGGMRPGAYQRDARMEDMALNHTDVSLCFPSVARFCGQFFMHRDDPGLAAECVRVYNDWMIHEWCGGPARGRLIPLTLVPMWDVAAAAAEVRRCADAGAHAVAFSESPSSLGLPSLYSGYWDPFIAACDDTDTVINMHIGSASTVATTAPDSPHIVSATLFFQYGMYALIDWVMSGALARFPGIRLALSEAQGGWMPFVLERMDKAWERHDLIDRLDDVTELPSSYVRERVFVCLFDDLHALESRDILGIDQMMFETDYPHADSTWPHSAQTAAKLIGEARLSQDETTKLLRGNAIRCYGLDRYFGVTA
jgi:predicted TIM-barrel fold metal-dependent hydrolase